MLLGELGGDRLRRGARDPGALEHGVEIARDAVGVAVARAACLRRAPIDLAPHRRLAARERGVADVVSRRRAHARMNA